MPKFDSQTSIHVDPTTGQSTSGGAARNRRIAEEGGQDQVQKKAYEKGYVAGFKDGFEEGRTHGAEEAYKRVDERLQKIEKAFLQRTK